MIVLELIYQRIGSEYRVDVIDRSGKRWGYNQGPVGDTLSYILTTAKLNGHIDLTPTNDVDRAFVLLAKKAQELGKKLYEDDNKIIENAKDFDLSTIDECISSI